MSIRRFRVLVLIAAAIGAVVWWATPSSARLVPQARAALLDATGTELGTVTFVGRGGHATQLDVELDLPPNAPGLGDFHGLHVHATGSCVAPTFTSAGGHWDEGGHTHGAHLGDLPSVLVDDHGNASLEADIPRFDVDDIVGRSVVLHAGRDNFGNVPTAYTGSEATREATARTGDAGGRYGCGVIAAVGRT